MYKVLEEIAYMNDKSAKQKAVLNITAVNKKDKVVLFMQ